MKGIRAEQTTPTENVIKGVSRSGSGERSGSAERSRSSERDFRGLGRGRVKQHQRDAALRLEDDGASGGGGGGGGGGRGRSSRGGSFFSRKRSVSSSSRVSASLFVCVFLLFIV